MLLNSILQWRDLKSNSVSNLKRRPWNIFHTVLYFWTLIKTQMTLRNFRYFWFLPNLEFGLKELQNWAMKVIPQESKFSNDSFETFYECSLPSTVSRNTIKKIGHHALKRAHLCLITSALFHQFKLHFAVAGSVVFLRNTK